MSYESFAVHSSGLFVQINFLNMKAVHGNAIHAVTCDQGYLRREVIAC